MRTGAFLALVTLGAIITYCYRRGREVRERRADTLEAVGRWEGDGGGAMMPPPARTVFPDGDPSIRH